LITLFDDQPVLAKLLSPEFWAVPEGSRGLPFIGMPEFPYNTLYDRSKEAHVPKTSPIRSAVSIGLEHRLVMDTDRRGTMAGIDVKTVF